MWAQKSMAFIGFGETNKNSEITSDICIADYTSRVKSMPHISGAKRN